MPRSPIPTDRPASRGRPRRAAAFAVAFGLLGPLADLTAATAAHATVGTPVADRALATSTGDNLRLLRGETVQALVFVRGRHDRSRALIQELATCRAALGPKAVTWTLLVSDAAGAAEIAEMAVRARFDAPVLVDAGDGVYGSLGIALHPVLVLVDRERRLVAFEPYRAVNYCDIVTARVRHALGEIGEEALRAALEPAVSAPVATEAQAAQRYRALAESLLRAGNRDKALEMARRGLEKDPQSAKLRALVAEIEAGR